MVESTAATVWWTTWARKGSSTSPQSYTPQQNGKSERDNRTIMESVRAMLIARDLPLFLSGEAVTTAVYVLNRTPNRMNQQCTPFEAWAGNKANLSHLRTFGAEAYVHIPKKFHKKLDKNAKKVIPGRSHSRRAPPDLTTSRVNFTFPDFHDEGGDPLDQEASTAHDVDGAEAKVADGVDTHHAEYERNEDAAEAGGGGQFVPQRKSQICGTDAP